VRARAGARRTEQELIDTLEHFQQLQRNADLCSRGESVAELICLLMLDPCVSFDAEFPLTKFLQRLLGWTEEFTMEFTASQVSSVFKLKKNSSVPTLNLCQFQLFPRYPTPSDLKKCYNRGMGMLMAMNAASIDMVIPIKLSENMYSAIAIQVKNWQDPTGPAAAKSILDAIGWTRVFASISNNLKGVGQPRASKLPVSTVVSAGPSASTVSSGAFKKQKTSAASKASKSAVNEFVAAQPKPGTSKRSAVEAPEPAVELAPEVEELHAVFKDVRYCKLLFLMRDHGENELFVEKNQMETVLCGVLRGMPRGLKAADVFESMVENSNTHLCNVDMLFADSGTQ
jgi:hypothetical protein